MGKTIELTAGDGHKLAAHRADPAGKPRGGVVVIQEIFGVNSHIRSVADGYAADGYLVIAPAMFDRAQRNYETGYTQPDIQAGIAIMQKLSWDQTVLDARAAIEAAKSAGKVGIVGYCWGGTVAWVAAARIPGLACAAPYYGGAIPSFIAEKPKCPVMFHFGEQDHSITLEQAKKVAAAHPEATTYYYPAGHGFNCDQRGSYDAASAKLARSRTLEFFRKHVG
ncbi:MAG: dienelactone hydrolase family protein [Betaproteobacteria bacterium]|nr:dienelactone hydrolase family protein [Betaproteobacteria bacterium]